jgi:hypothetical protein
MEAAAESLNDLSSNEWADPFRKFAEDVFECEGTPRRPPQ